jgi:hypothetical protein
MQVPQRMQRSPRQTTSGAADSPSGLWHHEQRSGQPLRKTAVRIPGPSWIEKRRMSKTTPAVPTA